MSVISLPCPTQWSPALCTSLDTVLPYLHLERKVLSASRRSNPGAFKAVGPHLEKGPLGERPKESRNRLEMRYKAVAPLLKEGQQWKGTIRASLEECLRKAQLLWPLGLGFREKGLIAYYLMTYKARDVIFSPGYLDPAFGYKLVLAGGACPRVSPGEESWWGECLVKNRLMCKDLKTRNSSRLLTQWQVENQNSEEQMPTFSY